MKGASIPRCTAKRRNLHPFRHNHSSQKGNDGGARYRRKGRSPCICICIRICHRRSSPALPTSGRGVRHGLWHARFVLSFVLVLAVLGTALVCVVSGGIADVTAPYILSPDGLGTLPDGERFDCVLILGAGLRPDGSPSDMLADRVRIGCAVYLSDPARFGMPPSKRRPHRRLQRGRRHA